MILAMEIGRVCLKIRGREAGKRCVIIDVIDRNYVLVTGLQGEVRRRRVNMSHLQPLDEKLEIEREASDEEVRAELHKIEP